MNGAELAEGVVLQVEPAASSAQESATAAPAAALPTADEQDSKDKVEEDLDDFFDSL